jgi:hypothetical protein
MKANAVRTTSIAALTGLGLLVASQVTPSKKRTVYWGITDQLDQMNGAIEVGEELKYASFFFKNRPINGRYEEDELTKNEHDDAVYQRSGKGLDWALRV